MTLFSATTTTIYFIIVESRYICLQHSTYYIVVRYHS
jgi:hypothetical protein